LLVHSKLKFSVFRSLNIEHFARPVNVSTPSIYGAPAAKSYVDAGGKARFAAKQIWTPAPKFDLELRVIDLLLTAAMQRLLSVAIELRTHGLGPLTVIRQDHSAPPYRK
jgi:hypothetical protein